MMGEKTPNLQTPSICGARDDMTSCGQTETRGLATMVMNVAENSVKHATKKNALGVDKNANVGRSHIRADAVVLFRTPTHAELSPVIQSTRCGQ